MLCNKIIFLMHINITVNDSFMHMLFFNQNIITLSSCEITDFSLGDLCRTSPIIKGRVSDFWKPMLIFEIIKTNTPLPQKGLAPILIDPPHIYVAYATQATISSVKHKQLFHRNYREQYVAGTFFPPDLLLSAFPSQSKLPRRLGK